MLRERERKREREIERERERESEREREQEREREREKFGGHAFSCTWISFTTTIVVLVTFSCMIHIIIDDLHCIVIERENSSLPEPTGDIRWHYRFVPSLTKNGIESQNTSRVALVEPMAFLLPVLLEWSKKTNVKGLELMRGVWWKTKITTPFSLANSIDCGSK